MPEPRLIETIAEIAAEADAFLLDQFGTLHDGARLYPGVAARLRQLRQDGKRIIVLSNSGKRAAANAARLAALGLSGDHYDSVLTSGEVAWQLLAGRHLPGLVSARRCLLLSRGEDAAALAGLDLRAVADPSEADFILLLGSEADRIGLEAYRALLAPAAAHGLPCLCANPDLDMVLGEGRTAPAPGAIAALYAAMGGPVTLIGKPGGSIYEAAFRLLAPLLGRPADRGRIWAVGDSLAHDIAGAAAQGCPGLLIRSGLAADLEGERLAAAMRREAAWPDAVAARF